jgi:hypothetical protein
MDGCAFLITLISVTRCISCGEQFVHAVPPWSGLHAWFYARRLMPQALLGFDNLLKLFMAFVANLALPQCLLWRELKDHDGQ